MGKRWVWRSTAAIALCAALLLVGVASAFAAVTVGELVGTWGTTGAGDSNLNRPRGIAFDAQGNVYVADEGNNQIKKFTPDGIFISKIGDPTGAAGSGPGQFNDPIDVAVDADGNIYTVEFQNNRVQKFASDGTFITTWGSYGSGDGNLKHPYGITVDPDGYVYVADSENNQIKKFTNDGTHVLTIGKADETWGSADGEFFQPYGLEADSDGYLYVADSQNGRIQKFDTNGVFVTSWSGLSTPFAVTVDPVGDVLVSDSGNGRVKKFSPSGALLETWGSSGTGPGQLFYPGGIGVGPSTGYCYVADFADRVQYFTSGYVAPPETQVIDNGILKVTVQPEARPDIRVWGQDPYDDPGVLSWVTQYYGEDNWGSVVLLDDVSYSSGYVGALNTFVPVSNTTAAIPDGKQIVTVVDLGDSGVRMTQTFTLMDGARYVTKDWSFENTGETSFGAVRLYHGGDTYFGGEDDAFGFYDPAKSMVYVRNNLFEDWGIMGFYANPGTPASHYFEGDYSEGNGYPEDGVDLPDTVLPEFVDAGYYLQWDSALAQGATWAVQAYEVWTPGGPLQILAPGPQNVAADSVVVLPFTIQNLSEVPQEFELSATSAEGWATRVLGSTESINATSSTAVLVEVTVPAGASGSSVVELSAVGAETDASASTVLEVVDLDVAIDPSELTLSAPVDGWDSGTVTITNNSDASITIGTITVSDPLFGLGELSVNPGTVLESGGSVVVDPVAFMSDTAGTFYGTLNIPITSPTLLTRTVALTGVATDETVSEALEGTDRYSTAIEVSQEAFAEGADAVVIATGEKFPDALGGSALAGVLNAPVLLTEHGMLLAEVAAEIERLGASEVYILGGESALTTDVSDGLADMLGEENVYRIGGADRYETAELVAAEVIGMFGDEYDGTAFVATGENYADALAASPLAAFNVWPVYLAPQPVITADTIAAMQDAGVTDVILLGGDAAMPEGTAVTILEAGFVAERIDGADRYETAAKVARYGVTEAGMSWDGVTLATGETYADALAGGAAQGSRGSVMLLTTTDALPTATADALADNAGAISTVSFLGGLSAISQAVRDEVMALF